MTVAQTVPDQDTMTTMLKVGGVDDQRDAREVAWDEKGKTKIAQIFIWHSSSIHALAFNYIDDDGKLVLSPQFGSAKVACQSFDTVTFTDPLNEYITRISGSYGSRNFEKGVTSLAIETNEATYGPFGCAKSADTQFNCWFGPHNQFGGFHGTSFNEKISSIGVYVHPVQNLDALPQQNGLPIN